MPKASYNTTLESELFEQEGFRDSPYKDTGGTTTIGFGYTKYSLDGKDGRPHWSKYWNADGTPTGAKMTKSEAKRIAPLVVEPYIDQANSLLTNEDLTESQRNALVNLIYRNGIGNVKRSGVVDKLNSGDIEGAQKIIKENDHLRRSGGSVLQEGDVGYNGITSRNNNIADSLTVTSNSEPEYDPATDPSLTSEVTITDRGVSGTYDDWKGVEPGDHEDGDIIKVGDRHFEYQENRNTYAPHDIETGETEDFADGHGGITEWTVGSNPERLPDHSPNPNYRKNRNEDGQYVYNNMDDVKKGKAKLKDGDELLVDGKVYKYDSETKDLISFSETGEIDEANNINVDNIGVEPVVEPTTTNEEYPEVTQEMIDDGYTGKGTITYSYGIYEGEIKDGKENGQGTITYNESNASESYVGEWKDGKQHGQGTDKSKSGYFFTGEFKDDDWHSGTLTNSDGSTENIEEGNTIVTPEMIDGGYTGKGTITYPSGNKYVGEFNDGKYNGKGTMTYPSGTNYVGEFKDDAMHGKGTYTSAGGGIDEGDFREGDFMSGTRTLENGDVYESRGADSTFDEDLEGGNLTNVKITYANGDVYEGELSEGEPNGGALTSVDGTVYEDYKAGVNVEGNEDEITDEEDEPIIEEEEEVQYQVVLDADGNEIRIPIGENVEEQDIEQELQAETTGEKVYESWDHVHNDPDLDRSEVIVIGENRYKWKVNEGGAEGSTTDGQYHIVDESGEFVPEENNEIQLIAQEPVIEATTTPEQTVLIGNERGEYSKNLNGEWIHTDPSTGTTTIVSDPTTLETLEGTIEQPVVENEVVEEELDVDGSEIEDVSGNSDFKQKATKALKVMGSLGESVMTGASSLLDAVGGPGAIVSYLMGKESLKDAMKEVTPKQKANLSASFMEHLRQTKELQKRGFHPTEARAVQKEIDTAYQVGLENSIRGTAGDRAKYLAQSGVLDAKRSSALLEYSVKDAELQRTNQTKYTAMLNFKENFDAQRTEALRAEDMKAQQEKQKAASEFTGQMFKNVMSGLGGNKIGSFFQQNQAELTSFIDNITKNK
mgnify:CR=1 FL=1